MGRRMIYFLGSLIPLSGVETVQGSSSCEDVWSRLAGDYSCGARINWLESQGNSEEEARYQVAVVEFPEICGPCALTSSPTFEPTPLPSSKCDDVWSILAGDYTCGARINWLESQGNSEERARYQVAVVEFPEICGPCAPSNPSTQPSQSPQRTPTHSPTFEPTHLPTSSPSVSPTFLPTTLSPTFEPTPLSTSRRECEDVWSIFAGDYTCGARINWLISQDNSEEEARYQVAVVEYPEICGPCAPLELLPTGKPSAQPSKPSQDAPADVKVGINLSTQLQNNPLAPSTAIAKLQDIASCVDLSVSFTKVKFFDYDTDNVLSLIDELDRNAPSVRDIMVSMPQWQVQQKRDLDLEPLLEKYGQRFEFEIAVGNEPNHPGSYYAGVGQDIANAMEQAKTYNIPVTVAFSYDCMAVSYPPEQGEFTESFLNEFRAVLELSDFITVNTYSFFAAGNQDIPRSDLYGPDVVVLDNSIRAFQFALQKIGLGSKEVVLGETGWPDAPSGGDRSVANAKAFYQNTVKWAMQTSNLRAAYLFEAFDEERKSGPEQEKHFGIMRNDGTCKW